MPTSSTIHIEKTTYQGWPNCYRLTNGEVELIATSDVGPRILRYGFVDSQNLFANFALEMGSSGEQQWKPRGGHRLWAAPEIREITYALDNSPIEVTIKGGSLSLLQPVEPETGLQKEMILKLAPTGSAVEVLHRIKNTASTHRRLAPWALTMMAPSGMAITGFPPRGSHETVLSATNPLVMWAYTDFSDKRWHFTKKYLVLQQDPHQTTPQKTGLFHENTFGAYLLGSDLFIKRYQAKSGAEYPDFGCSYETFANHEFLEIETVGPLVDLVQGKAVEHVEQWSLHKDVQLTAITDEELDRILLPLL